MTKRLRVLFVEDNRDDVEIYLHKLHKADYTVHYQVVQDEAGLRSALESEDWDIILCDHNMPSFDAPSALAVQQQLGVDVPFLVVSGSIDDGLIALAMQAGAHDLIHKHELSRLIPVIEREQKEQETRQQLRRMEESIHVLAHYDTFTGLPNRDHLLRQMRSLMGGDYRWRRFSLMLMKLHHHDQPWSVLGTEMHSLFIKAAAQRFSEMVKEDVFLAGQDELVVIVAHPAEPLQVEQLAASIVSGFQRHFEFDGNLVLTDFSIGMSVYPDDGVTAEEILGNAGIAVEHARLVGGKEYCWFTPALKSSLHEKIKLGTDLYKALQQQEFFLLYQPQVNIGTGAIVGVEALLRWNHPELGCISPEKFIPQLEETGLIVPVGEWVLRTACEQGRKWLDQGAEKIKIAVNLSVVQFYQNGLDETVKSVLGDTRFPPEMLELEITENIALKHEDATISTMAALKDMGVTLAIDDFGTGYSSLAYLQKYPVGLLKIDQSFTRNLISNQSENAEIIKTIIAMAHHLGLDVLAEGVETQAQAMFMLEHGCHTAQGYYYAKPAQASQVDWLRQVMVPTSTGYSLA